MNKYHQKTERQHRISGNLFSLFQDDEKERDFWEGFACSELGNSLKNAENRESESVKIWSGELEEESHDWKTFWATSPNVMLQELCGESNFMAAEGSQTSVNYLK